MEGVVKLMVPVPAVNGIPKVEFSYQSIVSPEITLPLITTFPIPIVDPSVPVGLEGKVFTTAVPVLTFLSVANNAEQTTSPNAEFEALLFKRT